MSEFLKRLTKLFSKKSDHLPELRGNIPYCCICGMDHKTGVYEFRKGDRVEVFSGVHDGIKGKVLHADYKERTLEIMAGIEIEVRFDRVLNLAKGRAHDVTGLLKRLREEEISRQ